ncbi:MAG: single-stranded DNA-binding protein [Bacilli bacterium]
MINNCTIVGRIANKIELKRTESNKSYVRISLAVERNYINKFTNNKDVDFISVVVWGQSADNINKYLTKGSLVGIEGNIQVSKYEKDGNMVYQTDIVASKVQFMESKEVTDSRRDFETNINNNELPF